MAKLKLKKCPFCGSEAKMDRIPINDAFVLYGIKCKQCYSKSSYYKQKQSAIDAWNKRS